MSIFDEIKDQPRGLRELMFALSVITVVALVGLVWFKSFQKDLYVLLNPDQTSQSQALVQQTNDSTSLFGYLGSAAQNAKAAIYSVLGVNNNSEVKRNSNNNQAQNQVHMLPLSGKK